MYVGDIYRPVYLLKEEEADEASRDQQLCHQNEINLRVRACIQLLVYKEVQHFTINIVL